MKKIYLFLFSMLFLASFGWGQAIFFSESFESTTGYSFPNGNGQDGQDFFDRTDLSSAPDQEVYNYSNYDGTYFIAGEDIDGIPGFSNSIGILLIENIDISGYTDIELTGAFASGTNIDIDDEEYISIEIKIDAGSWIEIGRFEADPSTYTGCTGNTCNGQFAEDTNGDGNGDGTLLNGTFADFTWSVLGTGSSLDIRVSMSLNSGDEEAAFDNIRISGIASSSGPQDPTAFSIDNTTSSQIGLSWTNAAESDGVWVVAREGAAPDVDITDGEGLYNYSDLSSTGNFSTATDLVDDEGYTGASGNILVYSGTGTSCIVSGLTEGNDYYFTIFNEYGTADWSDGAQSDPTNDIAEVQGTSGFAAAAGNLQADLSWSNPGGQGTYWDNVLILAKSGSAVDATPSGAGSGYTADAAFGSGDEVGTANYVVYSGTGTSVTVTGLTNGAAYHFKTFVYDGSDWTTLTETANCTPANVPVSGDIIINEIMYNSTGVDEEWIELYNTTGSSINLTSDWELSCTNASWTYNFDGSVSIAAGDFVTIQVGSSGSFPFTPDIVRSSSANQLVNSTATITIKYNSTTINSVTYDDGSPWPTSADGNGPSLELINVSLDNSIATNWQASYVDDGTPGLTNSTSGTPGLWKTDAASTDWFTASNWDDGSVPTSAVDVEIPAGASNYPTIAGATTAECGALSLGSGASLTIASDGSLTTSGVFSNPAGQGTLTVESDASGNGSFIPFGTSGPADIELYIAGHGNVAADGWHLISMPVSDGTFTLTGSDFQPGGSDDMYWWNETGYIWENYKETTFDFAVGEGYLCSYLADGTKVFDGWPNAGNVTVGSLSNTENNVDPDDDGWALLGNPFPSDVVWNNGDWTLSNVGGVAQIFDSENRNYTAVAADEHIASIQGFFVQVDVGTTGSVTIPASARDHGNSKWMKSNKLVQNALKLKVSGGTVPYYDQTQVRFSEDATIEYDARIDGHKLFGYAETPRLYTVSNDEKFSINCLPFSNDERIVPLNFKAGTNGEFTINVETNTVSAEGNIYLEDQLTDQMINLSTQNSYSFQASIDDNANRFLLHFNGVTGVEDIASESNIQVYSVDDMIYINSQEDLSADILVYNINGQLIHNEQMNAESLKRISLGTSSGVYLINIITEKSSTTHKVYVK